MPKENVHPQVVNFKKFVRSHPGLIKEVKRGNSTWQDLFEEWYILGDEDPTWQKYQKENLTNIETSSQTNAESKEEETSSGIMNQLTKVIQNMDANQMQSHLANLSQAIGAVQGVLSSFQGDTSTSKAASKSTEEKPNHPFSFRQD
ncbi:hypothetical protein Q73_04950 [Bacillus coahuilensis m2-6]|uniref:YlbD family protein n=1 Tax=Bacillus coahuilensis TaxID=408580 RepID=UPI0007505613|nr:YlbD family protein [Bacillus coahuilensis]KUP08545.1 hypothetical protein Q73_04950 [Bacillus coahuilensis m2-6]